MARSPTRKPEPVPDILQPTVDPTFGEIWWTRQPLEQQLAIHRRLEPIQYQYHVIKMPASQTPIPLRPLTAKRCTGNEVGIYQKTSWCSKQPKAQLEILFYNIHYQRLKQVLLNFYQDTIFTVISIRKTFRKIHLDYSKFKLIVCLTVADKSVFNTAHQIFL